MQLNFYRYTGMSLQRCHANELDQARQYNVSPVCIVRTVWLSRNQGRLPELSLTTALGLLTVAYACVGTRAAAIWASSVFWSGLAVLIAPVTLRLAAANVSRKERIALVVLLGMAFYLVKVMHNPFAFTFPDELSHFRNVQEVLHSRRLFIENPVLPVTALYPGLQTVTSTLVLLTGLPIFYAGVLVIGAARLVMYLALFLLQEEISGSARVAGIGTVLYMANTNFLFWTAQYAYESLALPLLIWILYAVTRLNNAHDSRERTALTLVALLGIVAVMATHHMTSYALTVLLWVVTGVSIVLSRGKKYGPWGQALAALAVFLLWLVFVATLTINYLSPVLVGAFRSVVRMIIREETTRQLFTSSSTGVAVAPPWEQWVAIGGVLLVVLALPFGLLCIWKRHRNKVMALVLATLALAYFPMQALRLTPAGWETSNRASEFLFIGISFVLAIGIVEYWLSWRDGWLAHLILALVSTVLFFGGVIAGWPPKARLPRPYVVAVGNRLVEPQGVLAARWMLEYLGPGNRVAIDASNAKLAGAYGLQHPFTRRKHGIQGMFFSDNIGRTESNIIRKTGVQYVAVDRRLVSWDHMIGFYFNHVDDEDNPELELIEPDVYQKFDTQKSVNRIFDSGNITVYDVRVYHDIFSER